MCKNKENTHTRRTANGLKYKWIQTQQTPNSITQKHHQNNSNSHRDVCPYSNKPEQNLNLTHKHWAALNADAETVLVCRAREAFLQACSKINASGRECVDDTNTPAAHY